MQTLNRAFNPYNEDQLARETCTEELRFRAARHGEGESGHWNPATELWFAIKAAPGA